MINRFQDGISVFGTSHNARIVGNFIGTDVTGTLDRGNTGIGIEVFDLGATVGGTTAFDRNVISGNNSHGVAVGLGASANVIRGNYIGTNAAGDAAVPNNNGMFISAPVGPNTVGGSAPGEGNVISGNNVVGLRLAGASGQFVRGNRIGTSAGGTARCPTCSAFRSAEIWRTRPARTSSEGRRPQTATSSRGIPRAGCCSTRPRPEAPPPTWCSRIGSVCLRLARRWGTAARHPPVGQYDQHSRRR